MEITFNVTNLLLGVVLGAVGYPTVTAAVAKVKTWFAK